MHGKRLLERLSDMERAPTRRSDDLPDVLASIQRHVAKLLNTRQGSVPTAPDYGIPDFTATASTFTPESAPEIEQAVANLVAHYEPRLTRVQVTYTPRPDAPFLAEFRMRAMLRVDGLQTPVVFETILRPDGRLQVKE